MHGGLSKRSTCTDEKIKKNKREEENIMIKILF